MEGLHGPDRGVQQQRRGRVHGGRDDQDEGRSPRGAAGHRKCGSREFHCCPDLVDAAGSAENQRDQPRLQDPSVEVRPGARECGGQDDDRASESAGSTREANCCYGRAGEVC